MRKCLVFLAFVVIFSLITPLIQAQLGHEIIEIPIRTEYFIKDQTQITCNLGRCLMILKPIITYQINYYKIDPNIDIKVIDIINNTIKFEINSKTAIPFKSITNKTEKIETQLPLGTSIIIYKPEGNATIFDKRFVFGQNSTILELNSDYDLDDARIRGDNPNTNYGSEGSFEVLNLSAFDIISYIKFNTTSWSLLLLATSLKADLCVYTQDISGTFNISAYHVYNDDWNESSITWNNQPCGINLDNSSNCNLTKEQSISISGNGYKCLDIKNAINRELFFLDNKTSIMIIKDIEHESNYAYFLSKESGSGNEPYLNITYEIFDITPPIINLNSPNNNTWVNDITIIFNATGTDYGSGIKNASLWHDCNGIWHLNKTNNYSNQTQVEAIFNVNIADTESCQWNVYFCDYYSSSNCAWATNNFTLKVDITSPSIAFINQTPENEAVVPIFAKQIINFTLNDALNPIDKYFIEWITPSSAENISLNDTYYRTLTLTEIGLYQYRIYANDTLGNLGLSELRNFRAENIQTNVQIQIDIMKNLVITNQTCTNENTLRIVWGEEHTLSGITDRYQQVQNQYCEWGCDYYANKCRVNPLSIMLNFLIIIVYFIIILFFPLLMITRKSKKKKLKFIMDLVTIFITIMVYIGTIAFMFPSLVTMFGSSYAIFLISLTIILIFFPLILIALFLNNIAKHRYS